MAEVEPPRLVFAGVATEDALAAVDQYPGPDERVLAQDLSFGGGGPAATAAVAAARLGMSAAIVASVGDDAAGVTVRERLADEGVDVSGLHVVDGAPTSRSIVIVSGPERQRAIINQKGPELDLERNPRGRELLEGADWVHVDQHGWREVGEHLRSRAMGGETSRPALSVDDGNPIPGLVLRGVGLYAPTLIQLRERYGDQLGIDQLIRAALDEGAERVVVTAGGEGAYAADRETDVVHVKSPPVEIRSTLGAGDVFHGALLAAYTHASHGAIGAGIAAVAAYATTVATLSCRGLDGRSRIPDHHEVIRHLDEQYIY
ncbi:sugar kinase [Nesterenkonia halophila]|uniref:carbohydrate kinase family protein n=1 Tax=Nesterenkonia halophila TaxID=302044 RepID=UPI001478C85B|nr:PfkB family carbohydrate kinase [Nesterenkonia halophila]